jgi:hypothetical protein
MELAHSSEGYPIPALSPVDEAGLMFLPPFTAPRPYYPCFAGHGYGAFRTLPQMRLSFRECKSNV